MTPQGVLVTDNFINFTNAYDSHLCKKVRCWPGTSYLFGKITNKNHMIKFSNNINVLLYFLFINMYICFCYFYKNLTQDETYLNI